MAGNNWRVVGNYSEGVRTGGYGIIIIGIDWMAADNVVVYGNELTGGASGNKLDHAIYPHGGVNNDIGWNYIHDNNFDRGPMISLNRDNAQNLDPPRVFLNFHIHDNIIDVSTYPSRAIGNSNTASGSTFYIYNNVIIGGGPVGGSIRAASGELYIWNNTLYNTPSGGAGIRLVKGSPEYTVGPVSIVNNIIHVQPGAEYIRLEGEIIIEAIDSNCYYGNGSYTGGDANMVNADPQYNNPLTLDLSLKETSPCIDKGSFLVASVVQRDFNGVVRPQGSDYDIGAYEYVMQSSGIRGDVNEDGLVNIVDVQLAVNQFLGVIPQTQEADLNGDGVVNVIDVQQLVNIILGG